MLKISDRNNCFYWQTDRNLSPEDYEKYFLKRHAIPSADIIASIRKGVTVLGQISELSVTEPDDEVKKGNVNIVRRVNINKKPYIARIHPQGIKNGYFYVEQIALNLAVSNGLPAPKILEVHEARDAEDMDFVLMTAMQGITMESAIKQNPLIETDLLYQSGILMAKLHQVEVEKYGSFDNQIAKNEGRLVGLHDSYREFVWCGLEENLNRLIRFKVVDNAQAEKLRAVFKENNFEPDGKPRLVHNDFADWNILADDKKISAILDWDECHGGDPIADLACWSTFFSMERFSKFLAGYISVVELPSDFNDRFHYYRLRYTISKMALRVKRALVDPSDFVKEKIRVGTVALAEEFEWFDK